MQSLLLLGILSLALSAALTPLVRNWFRSQGIVDQPDAHRKLHPHPIPRVGGIAIVVSYLLAFALLLCTRSSSASFIQGGLPLMCKVFPAALVAFLTGLIDDIRGLRPWQKLIGQTAASCLAYGAGVRITAVAVSLMPHVVQSSPWWSFPVTIAWLIACMNAFNLIDGLDGLAAGVSLVATLTTLLSAIVHPNVPLILATLPLTGALLGFLLYNFNPATIFLGDCGSLFVGFMLGCFAVVWSEKSATLLGMTAPLFALCVPLLDTALAISRRFLRKKPIFGGDRGHIHHRLLDLGFSTRGTALVLYGIGGAAAAVSLALGYQQHELLLVLFFLVAVWIGVERLNYVEFGLARRMLFQGSFQNMLKTRIALTNLESNLAAASTADECWTLLKEAFRDFGFLDISARLLGVTYLDVASERELRSWRLEIPLSAVDFVWLTRARHPRVPEEVCLPFADVVRRVLEPKIRSVGEYSGNRVSGTFQAA